MASACARFGGLIVLLAVSAGSRAAYAGDKEAARAAYDRATTAFDAGDFPNAAKDYALADKLAPHPVALRWAIRSALKANNAVLGMNLVLRSEGRERDAELNSAIKDARSQLAPRVSLVQLSCANEKPCSATIDDESAIIGKQYITTGKHLLIFTTGEQPEQQWFTAVAGKQLSLTASIAPQSSNTSGGGDGNTWPLLSPIFPIVGAVVTAGLAAGTIASGVDTVNKNDAYLEQRTQALFDSGTAAQTRTNVLIGVTAAVGVATLAMGALSLDFDGEGANEDDSTASAGYSLTPVWLPNATGSTYAGVHLQGTF